MLFTVSCTTPDSNKSETTDAPSDTAESTVPANGAKKVDTKTVKLYHTAEKADVNLDGRREQSHAPRGASCFAVYRFERNTDKRIGHAYRGKPLRMCPISYGFFGTL